MCARYTPRWDLDVNCPLSGSKRAALSCKSPHAEVDERSWIERQTNAVRDRDGGRDSKEILIKPLSSPHACRWTGEGMYVCVRACMRARDARAPPVPW